MSNIPTIFFGTHEFATTILQGLLNSPLFSIELIVTQPDRPMGRKQEIQKSPVKLLAEKYNLKIEQPKTLKNYKFSRLEVREPVSQTSRQIPNSKFQLAIVAQYGLLIPPEIIDAPEFGTLNVHTSLLPKYRGASPIQSALINGETETGVTIMKMDEGLDTGPILLQKSQKIEPDDTYTILNKKLAIIGLHALLEAIPNYIEGKLVPKEQDNSRATVCKQLTREDGKIDWQKTAAEIYNLYRGLTPWPGVWTLWNNKRLKLLKIKPTDKKLEPGLVKIEDNNIYIGCNESSIRVLQLQLEGKKEMEAKDFLNGYKDIDDTKLK